MSTNPSTSNFRVNTYVSGDQVEPDLALGSPGDFVLTWQSERQDGDGFGIFARLYTNSALPLSPEFRVNTTTSGDQLNPAVALDAAGNFVVVWEGDGFNTGGSGQDVFAQRFTETGTPLGSEFRVNQSILQDQVDPDVAMDAAGNFVVVYTSEQQDDNTNGRDSSGTGIFGQRFDPNGTPVGREFRINTFTEDDQADPVIAMNTLGEFVVVWVSEGQDGSGAGIFGQRYGSDGVAIGAEFQVGIETENEQINPSVAIDETGSFVVTWQSDDPDSEGFDVYVQQFGASGNPVRILRANTTVEGDQIDPGVAIASDGSFSVVWASGDDQDGDGFGIFGQRFTASGRRQGGEFQVNRQIANDQTRPVVGALTESELVVAWQSETGSFDQPDIFGRLIAEGGETNEIRGTQGDDELEGTTAADRILGLQGDDTLQGLRGNDLLEGGAGSDTLQGEDGSDRLRGGSNEDTLDGGEGNDVLTGGEGVDTFVLRIKRGTTLITDFQDGIDRLGLSARLTQKDIRLEQRGNNTVVIWRGIELATLLGIRTQDISQADFDRASRSGKTIRGTSGKDTLEGTGGSDQISGLQEDDRLSGFTGEDTLIGGAGGDTLIGGADGDTLEGGNNGDRLEGNQGDDFLEAGNGEDQLFGGAGADTFFLEIKKGTTVIKDFQDGIDQFSLDDNITLSQITFTQQGADTLIRFNNNLLARVENIRTSQLTNTPSDFA